MVCSLHEQLNYVFPRWTFWHNHCYKWSNGFKFSCTSIMCFAIPFFRKSCITDRTMIGFFTLMNFEYICVHTAFLAELIWFDGYVWFSGFVCLDGINQTDFFFQPSYGRRKQKNKQIGGRRANWKQPKKATGKKFHFLCCVWGGGHIFGPYPYPQDHNGKFIMNHVTHLQ